MSMNKFLAETDTILLLSTFSASMQCMQVFALVPKDALDSSSSHMAMLLLAERDSLMAYYPYAAIADNLGGRSESEFIRNSLTSINCDKIYDPKLFSSGILDYMVMN
jgi:hypothetical protein